MSNEKDQTQELTFSDLSKEDLQAMLQAKIAELNEANATINEKDKSIISLKAKALQVHEENTMLKSSPELAREMSLMDYQLRVAQKFIDSGAFKAKNAEQAYVMIKAGAEMGMSEVESMQALYCVNGAVKFYGDKMSARLTKKGYKFEFLNETENGVDVRCYHENGFDETEFVKDTDQILKGTKAMGFAKKNKMRFHGVRMIASFHLPHLFGSVEDEFSSEFRQWDERENGGHTLPSPQNAGLLEEIQAANVEQLELIQKEHKDEIMKNVTLLSAVGKAKKRLEIE